MLPAHGKPVHSKYLVRRIDIRRTARGSFASWHPSRNATSPFPSRVVHHLLAMLALRATGPGSKQSSSGGFVSNSRSPDSSTNLIQRSIPSGSIKYKFQSIRLHRPFRGWPSIVATKLESCCSVIVKSSVFHSPYTSESEAMVGLISSISQGRKNINRRKSNQGALMIAIPQKASALTFCSRLPLQGR